MPAGTRAAAAAAAALALEVRACAAEPKREPSLLGEPKREPKRAPLVAVVQSSDAVAMCSYEADEARQGKSAVSSAGPSNKGIDAVLSYVLPNMEICAAPSAVSNAEADAAANRSSRRNPKLVIGAVSSAEGTRSPAQADGCGGAEAALKAALIQRQTIRRPRELACLQDWMPPGKNWLPP